MKIYENFWSNEHMKKWWLKFHYSAVVWALVLRKLGNLLVNPVKSKAFDIPISIFKGLFDIFKDFLSQRCQNLVTFLPNKLFSEWLKLKILQIKVVLVIRYSDEKMVFRKVEYISTIQNSQRNFEKGQKRSRGSYSFSEGPNAGLIRVWSLFLHFCL